MSKYYLTAEIHGLITADSMQEAEIQAMRIVAHDQPTGPDKPIPFEWSNGFIVCLTEAEEE